jgi:hypothetical protein
MRVNITGSAYIVDTAPQQFPSTPDDDRRLPKGWVIASELSFQQPIAVLITVNKGKRSSSKHKRVYCACVDRQAPPFRIPDRERARQ